MRRPIMQRTARRMMVGAAIAGVVVIAAAGFLIFEVFGGGEPAPVALSSLDPSSPATASGGGSFTGTRTDDAASGSLDAGTA
jgi:hypothetical protein